MPPSRVRESCTFRHLVLDQSLASLGHLVDIFLREDFVEDLDPLLSAVNPPLHSPSCFQQVRGQFTVEL